MLNTQRIMPITMATLRNLVSSKSLTFQFGKVPIPVARGICHRAIQKRLSSTSPVSKTSSVTPSIASPISLNTVLVRGYATTTTVKKTTTTKKTAAKPKKTTKKPVKKAAKKPAKKAVKKPKKKAAKKKPAPKKRKVAKKPATPTRPKVSNAPSPRALSGFTLYVKEQVKGITGRGRMDLSQPAADWKALPQSEKDEWTARAVGVNEARKQAYTNFVTSMTGAQVHEENIKRRVLAKKFKNVSISKKRPLKDPRAPKRPTNAYILFSKDNWVPGQAIGQSAKGLGQRWKSMSPSEKKPYLDRAEADKARYARELASYLSH